MIRLGLKKVSGNPDWLRMVKEAGIPASQEYVVPDRWGTNPRQMAKVKAALERLERKQPQRTEHGARVFGLEEWNEIGRAIAKIPAVFEQELLRLREIAEAARKVEEGERARVKLFGGITPAASGKRK